MTTPLILINQFRSDSTQELRVVSPKSGMRNDLIGTLIAARGGVQVAAGAWIGELQVERS